MVTTAGAGVDLQRIILAGILAIGRAILIGIRVGYPASAQPGHRLFLVFWTIVNVG
jgi:hypothetical protein